MPNKLLGEDYGANFKEYFESDGRRHFVSNSTPEEFDWEGFKTHMSFDDADLEEWKSEPSRYNATFKMFSKDMLNKWMIVEVVKAKGCGNGLKVRDRLYFKGMGHLVPELSDGWCGHNLNCIPVLQDMCHNLFIQGKDPNEVFPDHFSCVDTTCKYGWGYVESRVYIVDEEDLDRLDEVKAEIDARRGLTSK